MFTIKVNGEKETEEKERRPDAAGQGLLAYVLALTATVWTAA